MDQSLNRLNELVTSLNTSNSTTQKKSLLKNFEDCKQLLSYTYDTIRYQYGVTSANILGLENQLKSEVDSAPNFDTLSDLLITLHNRTLTGHAAIRACLKFIYANETYRDLILKVIDRNLEIRIGTPIINGVFPGCISEFSVALANSLSDYDPSRTKLDWSSGDFYVERKLDGVRTVALIDNDGNVTFKSRNGKVYDTLGVVEDQIKSLKLTNCVLDGECCLLNPDGTDNFQGMMKEIRKKNHTIQNAAYRCFDIIPLNDFYSKRCNTKYSDRYSFLKSKVNNLDNVGVIDAWKVTSWNDVEQYQKMALENNWEGLMLRKDVAYKGDRSNDLLKIKEFNEREFVVKSLEIGPFRVIQHDKVTGKTYEATENIVTTLFVEYEGNIVGVGSGMSIDLRRLWTKDQTLIVGKTITVKYFEATVDKNGNKSLRFPTLKAIHGIERNV